MEFFKTPLVNLSSVNCVDTAFYCINRKVVYLHNVLQISEGTNSVGIVCGIWAFAYVLLAVGFITNY